MREITYIKPALLRPQLHFPPPINTFPLSTFLTLKLPYYPSFPPPSTFTHILLQATIHLPPSLDSVTPKSRTLPIENEQRSKKKKQAKMVYYEHVCGLYFIGQVCNPESSEPFISSDPPD